MPRARRHQRRVRPIADIGGGNRLELELDVGAGRHNQGISTVLGRDEIFGDDAVAVAMVDRVVYHAELISFKGDSYCLAPRGDGNGRLRVLRRAGLPAPLRPDALGEAIRLVTAVAAEVDDPAAGRADGLPVVAAVAKREA